MFGFLTIFAQKNDWNKEEKLQFYIPMLLCEGHSAPAATLLLFQALSYNTAYDTGTKWFQELLVGRRHADGCSSFTYIVQMQTSDNSHCVDFVLLDVAEMFELHILVYRSVLMYKPLNQP